MTADNQQPSLSLTEVLPETEQSVNEEHSWLRRNGLKLSIAAAGIGLAIGLAADGPKDTWDNFAQDAPWAAGGLVSSEVLWIGGGATMLVAAGKKVGNPLKVRDRWNEIKMSPANNPAFKFGLAMNTVGALGTAAFVTSGSVAALPHEAWAGAFIWAAGDVLQTVGTRAVVYTGVKKLEESGEITKSPRPKVRQASLDDIDRLADIDLALFSGAYGEELPTKESVVEMLTQRYQNCPEWMLVTEMDGEVEGFVSAFPNNVPFEDFVSWEQSTANGTLDGKVDRGGKYAYVTNMTINHNAVLAGAREMLAASLLANAIELGTEYAYFESRMPHFRSWLDEQIEAGNMLEPKKDSLQQAAEDYMNLRREDGRRYDAQLRMYERFGYKLARVVPDAFKDEASLNFGVICKAEIPPNNPTLKKIMPLRKAMAGGLRTIAKSPSIIQKVL